MVFAPERTERSKTMEKGMEAKTAAIRIVV